MLLSWNTTLIVRNFGSAYQKSRSLNLMSGIKVHSITKEIQTFFKRLSQRQETKRSFGFGKLYCETVSVLKPELFSLNCYQSQEKFQERATGTSSGKVFAKTKGQLESYAVESIDGKPWLKKHP